MTRDSQAVNPFDAVIAEQEREKKQQDLNWKLYNEITMGQGTEASEERMREFIKQGAQVSTRGFDHQESTLLHIAAKNNNERAIKVLLENGCNIDARDKDERTPLNISARNFNYNTTKLLLENGADINAQDNQGNTALHIIATDRLDVPSSKKMPKQRQEMAELFLRNDKIDTSIKDNAGCSAQSLILDEKNFFAGELRFELLENERRNEEILRKAKEEEEWQQKWNGTYKGKLTETKFEGKWENFENDDYKPSTKDPFSNKSIAAAKMAFKTESKPNQEEEVVNTVNKSKVSTKQPKQPEIETPNAISEESESTTETKKEGLVSKFFKKIGEFVGLTKKEEKTSLIENQERSDTTIEKAIEEKSKNNDPSLSGLSENNNMEKVKEGKELKELLEKMKNSSHITTDTVSSHIVASNNHTKDNARSQ